MAAAAALLLAASGAAPKKRSNFIFFQPDEMRAESLGCYGNSVSKTPNLDAFAAQGTRFEQAHVSYTVCSQSRVAFMTAWPTHVRGHRSLWSLLHEWEPNLLKSLKSDGYTVKWWGKNDLLAHDAWNASVTSARTMGGDSYGLNPYAFGDDRYYSFLNLPLPSANLSSDYRNVAAAIDFLVSKPDEPFMVFLPLFAPHPPYSAPEPFYSSISPDDLPPLRPPNLEGKPDYHRLIREYRNLGGLDDAFWRKLQAVYMGSISFSDHLFGLLMAALEQSGLADSTTVAVFSDHGDYAGDYGLVEKWPSGLEDVLTRVPLIVRTPGGAQGNVARAPVQVFDIVPTVLELAGVTAQFVHFGTSLVPQLRGEEGDTGRTVFAEGGYGTNEPRDHEGDPSTGGMPSKLQIYYPKMKQQQEKPLSVCRSVMARNLTHKLVLRTDPTAGDHCSELYDLVADPRETTNVYDNPGYAAVQAELSRKIMLWYMQTSDVTPWVVDKRSGGYPWPPKAYDVGVDTPQRESAHQYV